MRLFALALLLVSAGACTPVALRGLPPNGTPLAPMFELVPHASRDVVLPVRSMRSPDAGPGYRYIVHVEPSGVRTSLHAVCIGDELAYAGGEEGVILRRGARTGWAREESGSKRTIRGLIAVRRVENSRRVEGDAIIFAVGDSGTILRRDRGGWHAEVSGTERDLYGIQLVGGQLLAVGDGGTMVQREATGGWRSIASHTQADLRAVSDVGIAVGRGGAIVECAQWTSSKQSTLACVPRPSPVEADLWAFSGRSGWIVLGAEGVNLELLLARGPAVYKRRPRLDTALRSSASNHYVWAMEAGGDTVAVGDGGAVVIFPDGGTTATAHIAGAPDLYAVAFEMLDGFAVGVGGTLVHLQIDGALLGYLVADPN